MLTTVLSVEKKTYVVVDGVDECPFREREQILKFAEEITSMHNVQTPGKLRVMVISQDENDIRKRLIPASELQIQPTDTEADIRSFVHHGCKELGDRFGLNESECQYISDLMCDRSKGM